MAIVLDAGQCGYDHSRIKSVLSSLGAGVEKADSEREMRSLLAVRRYDLVLVNRIFDLDGAEGLQILQRFKNEGLLTSPFMLVSNYAEAQQAAKDLGAENGFGKDALKSPAVKELLKAYLP